MGRTALDVIAGAMVFMVVAFIFAVVVITSGCATTASQITQEFDSGKTPNYRYDLSVQVNGRQINGMAVVTPADKYDIIVQPDDKIDRIIWQTCNEEHVVDKPSGGFWNMNKSFSFSVAVAAGLTDVKTCPLKITVLTQKQNRVGLAFLDFGDKRPEYQAIKGTQVCNGTQAYNHGAIVCQSASGLIQQIEFDRPVLPDPVPDAGCSPMSDIDGQRLRYRWTLSSGLCMYLFGDKDHNRFRLQAYGYDEVPVLE